VILRFAVSVEHGLVTDRQTDRQTHDYTAYTAMAWRRGKNNLTKIKSTMHDSQKAAISSYMGLAVYEIQRNSTSYDLMNKVILSTVHNFTQQLKAKKYCLHSVILSFQCRTLTQFH